MKLSLINARETSTFGKSIRYFQIGEEVVTFGEEISEGDSVTLSGSRLVTAPEDGCWLINLVGDSIFLTSGGEILLKGVYNSKIDALLRVPVNGWVLTYSSYDDEYTLFHAAPDKVEWESGINALVVLSHLGLEFPIEVIVEEEGDE